MHVYLWFWLALPCHKCNPSLGWRRCNNELSDRVVSATGMLQQDVSLLARLLGQGRTLRYFILHNQLDQLSLTGHGEKRQDVDKRIIIGRVEHVMHHFDA